MRRIEIEPSTRLKATWIAAHARDSDKQELAACIQGDSMRTAAVLCHDGSPEGLRWVARLDGQPVAAFGIAHSALMTPTVGHIWLYGTPDIRPAIPEISRFFVTETLQAADKRGITRLEVRSIKGYTSAHRWIERLGARHVATLREFGTGGEDFELYEWTRADWLALLADPTAQSPWLSKVLKSAMIEPTKEQAA